MKLLLILILIVYALALACALARKEPRPKTKKAASHGWGNRLRVLIIGATGGTGRQLVQQALDLGHQVTALVRKPAKLKIQHPNLKVIQGDVLDYASIEAAMPGQSAVVCALGHKRLFYPTRILSEGTRNILRAMKTQNVPRFICETALGIGNTVGRGGLLYTFFVVPFILPFYFWDKVRQEEVITESDRDWVIVRPGALTNGAARGQYRHDLNLWNFIWTARISRADVADFMLKQLTDDDRLGTAVAVRW